MRARALAALTLGVLALAGMPGASAGPSPCAPECAVVATEAAYLPPASVVDSGSDVVWSSVDVGHPTADSIDGSTRCFIVPVSPNAPQRVRFSIAGESLRATTAPGTAGAATRTCATARALPTGGFALPYLCTIHPQMRGALVVVP